MQNHRSTIKDLARVAKVSASTVSRALNNHPRISQKRKQDIAKLAKKMGYLPSFLARGLVTKKTFLIGLLVYDFRNFFYAELTRAIQEAAEELGYWVLQGSTDDDPEKTTHLVNSMTRIGVEGIIFASCTLHDPIVEEMVKKQFPVVLANRRLDKDIGDQVVLDNTYGSYLAVSHLLHLDHRRVGMIRGPQDLSTSEDRYRGYVAALKEKGLAIDKKITKTGPLTQESGYQLALKMMRVANPPSAIFCCDDNVALGAMKALSELGLRVPQDVGLVGFDDAEISSHPLIQLTTVSQDTQEMGRLAARMMVHRIEGKLDVPQKKLLKPHLVVRQSCGYKLTANGEKGKRVQPV